MKPSASGMMRFCAEFSLTCRFTGHTTVCFMYLSISSPPPETAQQVTLPNSLLLYGQYLSTNYNYTQVLKNPLVWTLSQIQYFPLTLLRKQSHTERYIHPNRSLLNSKWWKSTCWSTYALSPPQPASFIFLVNGGWTFLFQCSVPAQTAFVPEYWEIIAYWNLIPLLEVTCSCSARKQHWTQMSRGFRFCSVFNSSSLKKKKMFLLF